MALSEFMPCCSLFTIKGHMTCSVKSTSAPQSKNAVSAFQITHRVLSFVLENSWSDKQTINPLQWLKGVSTMSNIRTYNLLVWKWIDKKFWHQMDVSTNCEHRIDNQRPYPPQHLHKMSGAILQCTDYSNIAMVIYYLYCMKESQIVEDILGTEFKWVIPLLIHTPPYMVQGLLH